MARFEVDVKMIVEADDDSEAYHIAAAALDNLTGGYIKNTTVDGVTDLVMEALTGPASMEDLLDLAFEKQDDVFDASEGDEFDCLIALIEDGTITTYEELAKYGVTK